MLAIWKNPEFVRHARAELRPTRMVTSASVLLAICGLIALAVWNHDYNDTRQPFLVFYAWLLGLQGCALLFWAISACGQNIASERNNKTFDFLRTTRMSASEIIFGKLYGAPVMGYFLFLCILPIAVVSGLVGGNSALVLLESLFLIVLSGAFFGLCGLWTSMHSDRTSGGSAGVLLVIIGAFAAMAFLESPLPGLAGLSPIPAIIQIYSPKDSTIANAPTFFGAPVSFLFCTTFLYVTIGAWIWLMLQRNLKRELSEIRLLSRWQGVGVAAFLNLLLYAFYRGMNTYVPHNPAENFILTVMLLNSVVLGAVGLATLTPAERLKIWWRERRSPIDALLADDGLPWTWIVLSAAVAYLMFYGFSALLPQLPPRSGWPWGQIALRMAVLTLFTVRDILFLQFCTLTRMRHPLVKGFLYLGLYWFASTILITVAAASGTRGGETAVYALSPALAFTPDGWATFPIGWLVVQVPILLLVIAAIRVRLGRPMRLAPADAE